MLESISRLEKSLSKIRAGKANPQMLSTVKVDYYGVQTPLSQAANVSTSDAQTISVQPFDKSLIAEIENAITEANLGFNPSNNGNSIMITFPPLSVERRQELVKVASKIIEDGRISVRNIHREIIQSAKRVEEEQKIPEDDMKKFMDDIQEVTDSFIKRLNSIQQEKEVEILDK